MPEAKTRGRPPIQDADYNAARARKMEADAQMAELELLKAKRELVAASDVQGAWVDVLSAMKAKLLSLPTKCAPLIATETEIGIIQDIIQGQIDEALNELSAYEPQQNAGSAKVADGGSVASDANTEATAKTKRGRVGRPRKATIIGS